jgi:hypothetical protein
MIQRVQTLWMLLAAITVFLSLEFPFYAGTLLADNSYHALLGTENILLLIFTSALGTGILINIFLYKNRKLQTRIIIISLVLEFLIIFLYIRQISKFSSGNFVLWSALHLLIILFLIFGARGIYSDSKLVKDSNRLR